MAEHDIAARERGSVRIAHDRCPIHGQSDQVADLADLHIHPVPGGAGVPVRGCSGIRERWALKDAGERRGIAAWGQGGGVVAHGGGGAVNDVVAIGGSVGFHPVEQPVEGPSCGDPPAAEPVGLGAGMVDTEQGVLGGGGRANHQIHIEPNGVVAGEGLAVGVNIDAGRTSRSAVILVDCQIEPHRF